MSWATTTSTFLNNLLFDAEGNSRLYEVTIPRTSGTADVIERTPIVLTTVENNGGTIEAGFTTTSDDTIVAGRLELLHGAYIDAGGGYNTLEIDAKGVYAQPQAVLNVQEIQVANLANVYTDGYNWDATTYPDLAIDEDGFVHEAERNSFIDLSRAIDIERLVVTEGWRITRVMISVKNSAI